MFCGIDKYPMDSFVSTIHNNQYLQRSKWPKISLEYLLSHLYLLSQCTLCSCKFMIFKHFSKQWCWVRIESTTDISLSDKYVKLSLSRFNLPFKIHFYYHLRNQLKYPMHNIINRYACGELVSISSTLSLSLLILVL